MDMEQTKLQCLLKTWRSPRPCLSIFETALYYCEASCWWLAHWPVNEQTQLLFHILLKHPVNMITNIFIKTKKSAICCMTFTYSNCFETELSHLLLQCAAVDWSRVPTTVSESNSATVPMRVELNKCKFSPGQVRLGHLITSHHLHHQMEFVDV